MQRRDRVMWDNLVSNPTSPRAEYVLDNSDTTCLGEVDKKVVTTYAESVLVHSKYVPANGSGYAARR